MNKAREAGVEEAEIEKALEVGRAVHKGAANRFEKEAALLLREG